MKSLFLSMCLFGLLSVTGSGQTTIPPRCWKVENSASAICKQDGKFYLNPYIHCGEKTCWTGDKNSSSTPIMSILTPGVVCGDDCPASIGTIVSPVMLPKPEPMDVSAIHVRPKCANGCIPPPDYWTCADKSRILLTDESGGKHCVKFPRD